jgi:uncharacterized membrane protein (UPF0127 family)
MRRLWSLCFLLLPFYMACGPATTGVEQLRLRTVTLPDGQQIRAEVLVRPEEMARGMMYRDSLPKGRGMLFIHDKPALYRYWMHNVKIPLDIIFMNETHKIVEISADTPPCTSDPKDCLTYGGHELEQFVLELGGGEARRLGLLAGQSLTF